MNSADLTLDQLRSLLERTLADLQHYAELRLRMHETGFPSTDPLYIRVEEVQQRLMTLRMHLHYEVSSREAGRPSTS